MTKQQFGARVESKRILAVHSSGPRVADCIENKAGSDTEMQSLNGLPLDLTFFRSVAKSPFEVVTLGGLEYTWRTRGFLDL